MVPRSCSRPEARQEPSIFLPWLQASPHQHSDAHLGLVPAGPAANYATRSPASSPLPGSRQRVFHDNILATLLALDTLVASSCWRHQLWRKFWFVGALGYVQAAQSSWYARMYHASMNASHPASSIYNTYAHTHTCACTDALSASVHDAQRAPLVDSSICAMLTVSCRHATLGSMVCK